MNYQRPVLSLSLFLPRKLQYIALDQQYWIVVHAPTRFQCPPAGAFSRLTRLLSMKTVFVACVFVLALFSVTNIGSAFPRFSLYKSAERPPLISLNQQILSGQPLRFYGRFRNGNDDVLMRYLNRN
ncbi:hypothetical protein L596_027476 [Steinernema carpocapsae]|uniref:Uncharacterized protein n=1 Tax=Steinernema carpocapsae TaxID=34508 RepID=A0A4U5LVJ4_STECR|nr:hypothetical protein L596_027476 [Steinernema carpocapsae]